MTASHLRALALLTLLVLVSAAAGCQNGACADGLTACGVTCQALQSDPQNCGACGLTCGEGAVCCDGTCVDPATDSDFCGASGTCLDDPANDANSRGQVCASDRACAGAMCQCMGAMVDCDGACVDTSTDLAHCGTCNNACDDGSLCCTGGCVDPAADPDYCGATGNCTDSGAGNSAGAMCLDAQVCDEGACVCPDGLDLCGTDCVDTETDPAHCGACNDPCDPGETCQAGDCLPDAPPASL